MPNRNDKADELIAFIKERHTIWRKRQANLEKPWTNDPILQNYRFCNVYRELDRVTQWLKKNWRDPHIGDRHLWFAMVVARYINLPGTLRELGYPVPWQPELLHLAADNRKNRGVNVFNAAYIISTQGAATDKITYLTSLFDGLWHDRELLVPRKGYQLAFYNQILVARPGIGNFMSGQIIADLKYAQPLCHASDWHTFAVSGPGSRRGLNRVLERPFKTGWVESSWYEELIKLRTYVNARLPKGWEKLHAQDLQNCLCEWDKYQRAKVGDGRPKQKYSGRKD